MRGVKIGKNVFIGLDVHIDDDHPSRVSIEDNVFITAEVFILTHKRNINKYRKDRWIGDCPIINSRVIIQKGAHIGIRSIILPGVTIGKGAVIGAGSIVTKDIPPYTLAMGIPAKVVKEY